MKVEKNPQERGCLGLAAAGAALLFLAPIAALSRIVAGWRRGSKVRFERHDSTVPGAGAETALRIRLDVDVPTDLTIAAHRELTDALTRIAASLRKPDDAYHLVFREKGEAEASLIPLGPQIQVFGERLATGLGRAALEQRTCLWLCLDRSIPIGGLLDPLTYDPEGEGQPSDLCAESAIRWLAATSFARRRASVLQRSVLFVPPTTASAVETILHRLERRLAALERV